MLNHPTIVRAGSVLICKSCGHKHSASADWLEKIRAQKFPKRVHPVIYENDIHRLKCSKCGAKDVKVIDEPRPEHTKEKTEIGCNVWGDIPFYPDWRDQG